MSRVLSIYNARKYINCNPSVPDSRHIFLQVYTGGSIPGGRIEKETVGFLVGGAIDASLTLDIKGHICPRQFDMSIEGRSCIVRR